MPTCCCVSGILLAVNVLLRSTYTSSNASPSRTKGSDACCCSCWFDCLLLANDLACCCHTAPALP